KLPLDKSSRTSSQKLPFPRRVSTPHSFYGCEELMVLFPCAPFPGTPLAVLSDSSSAPDLGPSGPIHQQMLNRPRISQERAVAGSGDSPAGTFGFASASRRLAVT